MIVADPTVTREEASTPDVDGVTNTCSHSRPADARGPIGMVDGRGECTAVGCRSVVYNAERR